MSVRNGVDQRIKVERWKIWVLSLDKYHIGCVVPAEKQILELAQYINRSKIYVSTEERNAVKHAFV